MANAMTPEQPAGKSRTTSPAPAWDFACAVLGSARPGGRTQARVPHAVEQRYLRVDDRFFFPDRTLAFIDEGSRIRVRTENREVMHSVIAIAEARGWRVIELRGSEAFRQGMWREAALRGIDARGYRPTEVEIHQVERARKAPYQASVEPENRPEVAAASHHVSHARATAAATADSPGSATGDDVVNARSPRDGPRPPIKGVLLAAAAAPYQFDSEQRLSFYVMVRTEVGERTIWGADLERALAESTSQPHLGSQVVLRQHGTSPVNVRVPARDEAGDLIGEKKIVAQRARWSIETPQHERDLQRQARLLRTGDVSAEAFLDAHPALAAAAAGLKLAQQYARRVTADPTSQEQLVRAIRERMAIAVEQGHDIHLPKRKTPPAPRQVRQRGGRGREEPSHERT